MKQKITKRSIVLDLVFLRMKVCKSRDIFFEARTLKWHVMTVFIIIIFSLRTLKVLERDSVFQVCLITLLHSQLKSNPNLTHFGAEANWNVESVYYRVLPGVGIYY